ncbi:endonuclease [Motiliproteus coralliicola]|uniref:Endonuclease n=1 Tax=Motiliproteus coralliicola TaxID=2283196 RepID=A0A369WTZ6_9GAMM|nr:endonuclease/exonuclease/phosphatase family protein [Motiliproteus coralliicola]RDE25071.1 endonuclease [Motiliproteus coralliicola]
MSLKLLITALLTILCSPLYASSSCALHIASFNIHYIVPSDSDETWDTRKHAVSRILNEMDADIVAFQEAETFDGGDYSPRNLQLDWIHASTTGYQNAAIGNPAAFPITQPIIYKANKFDLLDQGFFFFSDTPDRIYSSQWNGGYPYFASWARFRSHCSNHQFFLFNVHNDYKSRSNRLKSSTLIVERIKDLVREPIPVIVLGDFNVPSGFQEVRLFEEIGLKVIPPEGSTNRIFGLDLLPAIDHILISSAFRPMSEIKVWRNQYDGVYPSDHYPISIQLNLAPPS